VGGGGGGGGGVMFKKISLVPWGYHEIQKMFPKMFPITPQIYPICFAQSSTLMYIS